MPVGGRCLGMTFRVQLFRLTVILTGSRCTSTALGWIKRGSERREEVLSSMLSSRGDRPTVSPQMETLVPGTSSWASLGASPSFVTFRSRGRARREREHRAGNGLLHISPPS